MTRIMTSLVVAMDEVLILIQMCALSEDCMLSLDCALILDGGLFSCIQWSAMLQQRELMKGCPSSRSSSELLVLFIVTPPTQGIRIACSRLACSLCYTMIGVRTFQLPGCILEYGK